jgi:predicted ribonuclease YlaK
MKPAIPRTPKKIKIEQLQTFGPLTTNQEKVYEAWKGGNHLVLNGSAGTGKTFSAMYLAFGDVLNKSTPYEEVRVIRSIVPTRDVGFMPGTIEEKLSLYNGPYKQICSQLFEQADAYDKLIEQKEIAFESTSYLRGMTFDNSIVIVDEMQNLSFHELDSVITRLGTDSKIIFCGDFYQSDFQRDKEKAGIKEFISIVEQLRNFTQIEFTWEDIVRGDLVRDYIMTKELLQRGLTDGDKQLRSVP